MIGSGRRRSFGITTALRGSIIEAAKADLADRPEPFYCQKPKHASSV
jgi:hypothetical protein